MPTIVQPTIVQPTDRPATGPAATPVRRGSSLQARMLIAYLMIGLLPMFFAAELGSQAVSHAFERNLRTWLRETAAYFLAAVADNEREANDVVRVLAQQPDLLGQLIEPRGSLPPLVKEMIGGEGYDLLAILDDHGSVAYSSMPILGTQRMELGGGIGFSQIREASGTKLMVAASRSFDYHGRQYQVLLGSWLDDAFFGHLSEITSFDFRLYQPIGGRFHEIFRSGAGGDKALPLDPVVVAAVEGHDGQYFDRVADAGTNTALYLPLRNDVGTLTGIVLCGLRTSQSATRWVSRTNVFLIIFLTGGLLSVLVGYFASRRLTGPLRSLASSVKAITAGDYGSRVQIEGHDEVAQLAESFNGMAERLGQLNELETQLRRQDRLSALGRAAAGIAHEIRNPLGIICTSAELVRNRNPLPDQDRALIDNVVSEVRRIDRLIGDLLAFAKPRPVVLQPLDPDQLIARVTEVCAPELTRRHVRLQVINRAGPVTIEGDEDSLHQAMLNVILNACDAMPGGGQLSIELSRTERLLHIDFADSGPGVAEELRDRIFDPFFTTKDAGSGLGLAKVRSVLEAHYGSVEYRQENGAVFEFVFPLAPR